MMCTRDVTLDDNDDEMGKVINETQSVSESVGE